MTIGSTMTNQPIKVPPYLVDGTQHLDERSKQVAENTEPSAEVGYCKPPNHSRFKKGQSGNPSGRPKQTGKAYLAQIVAREARHLQHLKGGGSEHALRRMVRALIKKAIVGEPRAVRIVFSLVEKREKGSRIEDARKARSIELIRALSDQLAEYSMNTPWEDADRQAWEEAGRPNRHSSWWKERAERNGKMITEHDKHLAYEKDPGQQQRDYQEAALRGLRKREQRLAAENGGNQRPASAAPSPVEVRGTPLAAPVYQAISSPPFPDHEIESYVQPDYPDA